MTEPATRAARRPSPALVLWGSIALFAVLFALITYQLASSQPPAPRPVVVRKVLKRKVITTYVPSPGQNSVSASGGSIGNEGPPTYAQVTTGAS